jgi:hypothetical protein
MQCRKYAHNRHRLISWIMMMQFNNWPMKQNWSYATEQRLGEMGEQTPVLADKSNRKK